MAGLYLHIPFCAQRCVYCDFYFVTTRADHTPFIDAMCTELAHYAAEFNEPIETIYFGGGTPSLLSPKELRRLFRTIREHYDLSALREVTLELNPDDAGPVYLTGLRELGINRLSIGIQSFFAEDLTAMNRSHTAEEAEAVVPMARAAGFDNFSVDLIFGRPGQPDEYWKANLEKVARLGVPHLSTYGLTVEPKTPLAKQIARGATPDVDEEQQAEAYRFTMKYLGRKGYNHYEISSFAKPGSEALHNRRYWDHSNYLGFGPSAHSFRKNGDGAQRWANVRNLRRYEAVLAERHVPVDWKEKVSAVSLADEYIMLRLRTEDGIDLNVLREAYGRDLCDSHTDTLNRLQEAGHIHPPDGGALRLTDSGKQLCDSITARLV